MFISNYESISKKARYLTTQPKNNDINFIHNEIGYNYRMTNMRVALGVALLEQIEKFIEIKKENYFVYKKEFENIEGLKLLDFSSTVRPNYWFYSLLIDSNKFRLGKE